MGNVPASIPVPGPAEQTYTVVARLVVEDVVEGIDKRERVHVARCEEISIELEPIVPPATR